MLSGRLRLRSMRLFALLLLIATLCGVPAVYKHRRQSRAHVLKPDLYRWSTLGPSEHLLLPEKTKQFCKAHGFKPFKRGVYERKIYDLFLLSTELDWLEIRLHTLSPYVEFFVIVEARTTFTGIPKPALLEENWEKFAPFHNKIIHRVVEDLSSSTRTWDHEDFLRNALLYSTFPDLVGTWQEPHEGDVLIVSDVDEIPKPEALVVLRKCAFPDRLTLRSFFYYYSFQWLHRGVQWAHPQATTYREMGGTISPQDLRNGEPRTHGLFYINHLITWWQRADFWNAAWHCSSCFATVREMQTKMESFSHTSYNTAENRDAKTIMERVRNGEDLFGRSGQVYDKVHDNLDTPAYIQQHPQTFGNLLDRDGETAGFTDVNAEGTFLPEQGGT